MKIGSTPDVEGPVEPLYRAALQHPNAMYFLILALLLVWVAVIYLSDHDDT